MEKWLSWLFELLPYLESRMDPSWHDARDKPWNAEENRFLNGECYPPYACPSNGNIRDENGYGTAHYVGIAGLGSDATFLPLNAQRAGMFGYERRTRKEDITDGLSNTLMAAETASANGPWAAGGEATVRGLDLNGPAYLGPGGQFGSCHPTVVSFMAFADGSVRSFATTLKPQVFEALATIAGRDAAEGRSDD
jgi:hypothetical protein